MEAKTEAETLVEIERIRGELASRGYVDVDECNGRRLGARVRGAGEQWDEAIRKGTGNIIILMEKPNSSWARTYRHRDIEMVVRNDNPKFEDWFPISQVADYHVVLIDVEVPA